MDMLCLGDETNIVLLLNSVEIQDLLEVIEGISVDEQHLVLIKLDFLLP